MASLSTVVRSLNGHQEFLCRLELDVATGALLNRSMFRCFTHHLSEKRGHTCADTYSMYTVSVMATNTFVRSARASAAHYFTQPMFFALGVSGRGSLIRSIAQLITARTRMWLCRGPSRHCPDFHRLPRLRFPDFDRSSTTRLCPPMLNLGYSPKAHTLSPDVELMSSLVTHLHCSLERYRRPQNIPGNSRAR